MQFVSKTEIINYLIEKFKYKTYLEIGLEPRSLEFAKITAPNKIAIDPVKSSMVSFVGTSDEFFAQNKIIFDIILIDGLHHSDQVVKDIENSLKFLSNNGTILMHDCNPTDELMQRIPRDTVMWTGDVWKAFVQYREQHPELLMFTVNTDYGVGIIRHSDKKHEFKAGAELSYYNFERNRKKWLNLIQPDQDVLERTIGNIITKPEVTQPEPEPAKPQTTDIVKKSDIAEIPKDKQKAILINEEEKNPTITIYNTINELIYLMPVTKIKKSVSELQKLKGILENSYFRQKLGVKYGKPKDKYEYPLKTIIFNEGEKISEHTIMTDKDKVEYIKNKLISLIENKIEIPFLSNIVSEIGLEYLIKL